ncbi:MAG: UPF0280 family protein [Sulfitobacter sp.]|nr:UPF0280 family protein [Sulfitobacter sp.]
MMAPQVQRLGARLHLHQGPIDLIIGVEGPAREACFDRAVWHFDGLLAGLAAELDLLRQPAGPDLRADHPVARAMIRAVAPHARTFVTPMAAVAGAVADSTLEAMKPGPETPKAWVNNGGDIAFHLGRGAHLSSLSPAGRVTIDSAVPARGLATSGWQGRSHSLGIADAVTVAAPTAAMADVAATLIANAVDLPGHPAIRRTPARDLSPDSDLGARPVTVGVGALDAQEIATALARGRTCAQKMQAHGLICEALLMLQGTVISVTAPQKEPLNA